MKGRDVLFSAFKAVDLTTLLVGAKAAADARREEREAIFIMVEVLSFLSAAIEGWAVRVDGGRGAPHAHTSRVKIRFNLPLFVPLTDHA